MGKIWMPGGGGGADLDVVTVSDPSDVLAGKVIVDKNGNPLTGTMPNRGAISQALGINGTYTIPAGYHNGSGKVTQSIATMGAQTINPTASQQIVSTSGKYLTGNVTVNGVSNLTAANIKKGINVGGTVGNFEGYVPTATDFYLRGNNIAGFTTTNGASAVSFESGGIKIYRATPRLKSNNQVNFTSYNYLNIQVYYETYVNTIGNSKINFKLNGNLYDGTTKMSTGTSSNISDNTNVTFSIPVSTLSLTRIVDIQINAQYDALEDNNQWVTYPYASWSGYVYRIWMS
jgi:hypothetical protein